MTQEGIAPARIPDRMPSDMPGTELLEAASTTGQRHLRFVPDPIFAPIVFAAEIDRTLPGTQAALLESVQERSVTMGGRTLPIASPFFVAALVLRHRILRRCAAVADSISSAQLVHQRVQSVPEPSYTH